VRCQCWLGDREDIGPVKNLTVGVLVVVAFVCFVLLKTPEIK